MRIRLLSLLVLAVSALVLTASPASAQKPIPGIKQTVAFKQLKSYVQVLSTKRNQPASPARRQNFKAKLSTRRKNANKKVNALYQQKLNRIKKQDDRQERQQVKQIRANQKVKVQGLQQDLAERLADLRADQASAVQRTYDRYAGRINSKSNRRDSLKRQLRRTTNPVKRARLTRQINSLQVQINGLVSDRNTAVNGINSRYATRTTSVTNLFNARIANARSSSKRQIQQVRTAWKQTFRTQFSAAKTRRKSQMNIVTTVATRGQGYIEQMPPVNE